MVWWSRSPRPSLRHSQRYAATELSKNIRPGSPPLSYLHISLHLTHCPTLLQPPSLSLSHSPFLDLLQASEHFIDYASKERSLPKSPPKTSASEAGGGGGGGREASAAPSPPSESVPGKKRGSPSKPKKGKAAQASAQEELQAKGSEGPFGVCSLISHMSLSLPLTLSPSVSFSLFLCLFLAVSFSSPLSFSLFLPLRIFPSSSVTIPPSLPSSHSPHPQHQIPKVGFTLRKTQDGQLVVDTVEWWAKRYLKETVLPGDVVTAVEGTQIEAEFEVEEVAEWLKHKSLNSKVKL